jgi:tetratricopeptide (TPR) repeat protein
MLIEGDRLRQTDGTWSVVEDIDTLEIPGTIQALLAARLDQLPREERAVAERASVIGRIFERAAVTELSPEPLRPTVGTQLRSLTRRRLIGPFEREDVYRFRHALIRDAAYEALPKEERAHLHERLAAWLAQRRDSLAMETEELIGYHLEQAHRYLVELGQVDERSESLGRRAGESLAAAGTRAAERSDLSAASTLLARAIRLLPRGNRLYWTTMASMGYVTAYAGRMREGMAMLDQALGELHGQDDVTVAQSRLQRFYVFWTVENLAFADMRRQLLSIFCSLPSGTKADKLRAEICVFLGMRYKDESLITRARRACEWGLHYAERSGDSGAQIEALIGLITLGQPTTTPVSELDAKCRAVLEMPGLTRAQRALVSEDMAYIRALAGRFEEARGWLTKATSDLNELGVDTLDPHITAGLIELMADEPERAEQRFRALYDWRSSGGDEASPKFKRLAAARLSQALQAQGRLADAEQMVSEASDSPEGYHPWADTIARGTMARILAQRGQSSEAVKLATRVVAEARTAGIESLPMLYGGALEDLAFALLEASDFGAAREVLTDALERYERKEYAPGVARVRSILDAIAA